MAQLAVSLGSNMGNRLENLSNALRILGRDFSMGAISPIYETDPMYIADQPAFYNAAVLIQTQFGPLEVLKILKKAEKEVGRVPSERYGPREIDLDLITYGVLRYRFRSEQADQLLIPHPRIVERRFVLQPLSDLDPFLRIPGLGTVEELLHSTDGQAETVRRVTDAVLPVLSP